MINKIKGRTGAKLLAAFLLFMACAAALACLAGMILFERYGLYDKDPEATRETLYGMALDKYSVQAMAAYFEKTDAPPENFLYGIYEGTLTAEELAGAKPLAGRSPETLSAEARIHTFFVSPSSTYTLADNILDTAYVHEDGLYIGKKDFNSYVRIAGSDRLYLLGTDYGLYPLPDTFWEKVQAKADSGAKAAAGNESDEAAQAEKESSDTVLTETETEGEVTSQTGTESEGSEATQAETESKSSEPTLAKTESEGSETTQAKSGKDRETFSEDTADTDTAGDITAVDAPSDNTEAAASSDISGDTFYRITDSIGDSFLLTEVTPKVENGVPLMTEAGFVYVISPRTSHIDALQENAPVTRYWRQDAVFEVTENPNSSTGYTVASAMADPPVFTGDIRRADFFEQADFLVRSAGILRYLVLILLPICGITGLLAFIFLMLAAGHRVGDKDVHLRTIDRMPLDLGAAAVCFTVYIALLPVYLALSETRSLAVRITVLAVCLPLVYALILWFIMSLAVNLKAGGWWRRTLISWLFRVIGGGLESARQKTAIVKMRTRIWILAFLLSFGEFLALVRFCDYYLDYALILWVIEKAVLFILLFNGLNQFADLKDAAERIASGDLEYKVDTKRMMVDFAAHGNALNSIGQGLSEAVGERLKSERMKTELITNVSHDIKTPLTSILNYTDLLTRLDLEDPAAREYLEVLSRQSIRLKKLLEDLIEASKASSGSLKLEMETLDASMLLTQAAGEFEDRLRNKDIDLRVTNAAEDALVMADSRYLWRVFDNLLTNVCKYAQPGTRAYVDMGRSGRDVTIVFRNISAQPLNITSAELLERFTRGDSSRNTEGSGLGLSIATSLIELMGGKLDLVVDGDLFKVTLTLRGVDKPEAIDSSGGPSLPAMI